MPWTTTGSRSRCGRGSAWSTWSPPSPSSTSRSWKPSAPAASASPPPRTRSSCSNRPGRARASRAKLVALGDGLGKLGGPGRVQRLEALEDLVGGVHAAELYVSLAEILERFGEVRPEP